MSFSNGIQCQIDNR